MDIRIGIIHSRDRIKVRFNGKYSYKVLDGSEKFIENESLEFDIVNGAVIDYDWYEKVNTFYDIDELHKIREKSFYDGENFRIEKCGRKINEKLDNFEYWVLKKISCPPKGIYKMGDYKYKRIPRKYPEGKINCSDGLVHTNRIEFIAENENCTFSVDDVTIGIGFHWEHQAVLTYEGNFLIIVDLNGKITGVNTIDLEKYLISVNSSEMRNDNNIEMLKAQTVAARGTVLATIGKHHFGEGFDLCADDHCQCYQGVTRITDLSKIVTESTRGEFLLSDKKIADTRYAKICGGVSENYSTCWEDMDFLYLTPVSDNRENISIDNSLSDEFNAVDFIDNDYDCFCNTKKHKLPESLDFCTPLFRWERRYKKCDLINLIFKNTGFHCGDEISFQTLKRGVSGRIISLKISGSSGEKIISKELNIRKALSDSFLPSSCIYFINEGNDIIIRGAGWGHGVGLCQVGAQVMGEKGYNYKEILFHYYKNSRLIKLND
ncbi:MAG: SpoIID/LytB domain-containing protein [Candidatus Delongbacteria bacterium]|nr:SpoIID/LytB domain-containing protein [Candidatus Delongbacteria bacterium]MBN2836355.1 SpoIID/LytB domain-containing protein [Candidatus Delongbacteria bacterium]